MPIVNFKRDGETVEYTKATSGCDVCPNCGEKQRIAKITRTDFKIVSCYVGTHKIRADYESYTCYNCWSSWESERFNFRDGWCD